MKTGVLVISLDYELMWGAIFNKKVESGYRFRTPYVSRIVPKLLELFEEYGIHATWAIVGAIACRNKQDATLIAPRDIIDPYSPVSLVDFIKSIKDEDKELYFNADSIQQIVNTPNQEIGTHTFSHFYYYEHENSNVKLNEEIEASKYAIESLLGDYTVNTLVMPKNQVEEGILDVMKECDIHVYRGKQLSRRFNKRNRLFSAISFIDSYIPIRGKSCYPWEKIKDNQFYNVRASSFWRTYDRRLALLESLKIHRIKGQMKYAAKHGEIFHLWFHPHNLSKDYERNLRVLEDLLLYYKKMNDRFGMKTLNMRECACECGLRG